MLKSPNQSSVIDWEIMLYNAIISYIFTRMYVWAVSFLFIMTYQVDRYFQSSVLHYLIYFFPLNILHSNRFEFTFDVKISEFEKLS